MPATPPPGMTFSEMFGDAREAQPVDPTVQLARPPAALGRGSGLVVMVGILMLIITGATAWFVLQQPSVGAGSPMARSASRSDRAAFAPLDTTAAPERTDRSPSRGAQGGGEPAP